LDRGKWGPERVTGPPLSWSGGTQQARGKGLLLQGKPRPGATGSGQDLKETIPTKSGEFLTVHLEGQPDKRKEKYDAPRCCRWVLRLDGFSQNLLDCEHPGCVQGR